MFQSGNSFRAAQQTDVDRRNQAQKVWQNRINIDKAELTSETRENKTEDEKKLFKKLKKTPMY